MLSTANPPLVNALPLVRLCSAAYSDDPASDPLYQLTEFADSPAKTFRDRATGTFGYVTASEANAVLCFRGTTDIRGWLTDFDSRMHGFPLGAVHDGFLLAQNAVFWEIRDALREYP